jgi:hypothetical protein
MIGCPRDLMIANDWHNELRDDRAPAPAPVVGVLLDQTYGYAPIPQGWVSVQTDDDLEEFPSDEIAAAVQAQAWGTVHAFFPGGGDLDEDFPGDWAVMLP